MTPPSTPKRISVFDTICLGVNAIIGSGIFLFPGLLAREAGPASILAFLVCGILLIAVALCYAELGSMYRRNGGSYVYAKEAFGSIIGFGVGWISWVTAIFSWAAVANAVSSYLGYFHPFFSTYLAGKGIALLLMAGFGIINYRGIKPGARVVNVLTVAKVLPLALFVLAGSFFINADHYRPFWGTGTGSFSYAVFLALWALQGFETTPIPSGESQNPQKAVPIAALGSLIFCTCMYVLIQAVAVGVYANLAGSGTRPLADACAQFLGPAGGSVIALGAVISMIGYNAGNALGSPRFLSALAEDRFLPGRLAAAHPRFLTPAGSILITTVLACVAALFFNFASLVALSNVAVVAQYLSTCSALLWLRRTQPGLKRSFKTPCGTAVAFGGCAISLWLIKQVRPADLGLSAAVLAVGFLCMWLFRRKRASGGKGSPAQNLLDA
jgi:amino acid transporter